MPPAPAASELRPRRWRPNIPRCCRWPGLPRPSAGPAGLERYFPAITTARQPEELQFNLAMSGVLTAFSVAGNECRGGGSAAPASRLLVLAAATSLIQWRAAAAALALLTFHQTRGGGRVVLRTERTVGPFLFHIHLFLQVSQLSNTISFSEFCVAVG